MRKFITLPLCASIALFVSCQKQQTEEERRADVEREVQARLAQEHQTQDQQQLALQQADLDKREAALKEREEAPERKTTNPASRARDTSETDEIQEPRSTETYGMFYQKLEPYGAWFETDDYGYVWQPSAAAESQSWRPYTDGHWVYTDAGWTWVSGEPFGWATYHYGRWVRLRNVGWVWMPGTEWAPAWVSWRTGGDYVGWAPLPPEAHVDRRHGIRNWADNYYDIGPEQYCFVRAEEIGAPRLAREVVPPQQNVTIINQTTNVTNITYNNTTIVNQGPNYDELRSRSRQPIERYRLERETTVTGDRPQPVVRGEVIIMPAPAPAAVSGYARPSAVKQRVAHADVDRGWNEIADRTGAEQARAKMKSEATPPPDAPPKTVVKPQPVTAASPTARPSATSVPTTNAVTTLTPRPANTPSSTPRSEISATATPITTATPRPHLTPGPTIPPTAPAARTVEPLATPASTPTAARAFSPRPSRFPSPTATIPKAERPSSPPNGASTPAAAASASPPTGFTTRGTGAENQESRREFEQAQKAREMQQREAARAARISQTPPAAAANASATTPAEQSSAAPASRRIAPIAPAPGRPFQEPNRVERNRRPVPAGGTTPTATPSAQPQ